MIATTVFQLDAWKRRRPSFTLVELLVVIAIIGILVGMVMYTLAGAQRDALTSRTRATIQKLNNIILQRWEEFRYRSVRTNIPEDFLGTYSAGGQIQAVLSPREGARVRMMILRDTMRMELPDRYTDIVYPPTIYKVATFTADNSPPLSNNSNDGLLTPERTVPGSYNNYRRKMVTTGALPSGLYTGSVSPVGSPIPSLTNQGAELLYQIVATSNYNGANGLEFFRPSEIGDTDDDGFPEFVDGWGRPIRWLRWPAGYGHVNPDNTLDPTQRLNTQAEADSARPPDWQLNDHSVPDALDPLHTDWRWSNSKFTTYTGVPKFPPNPKLPEDGKPWLLVPLIVSAGPDGMFDIQFDDGAGLAYATNKWLGPTDSPKHLPNYYFVDPYWGFYDMDPSSGTYGYGWQGGMGQWFDEDQSKSTFGAADNITNYSVILE